MFITTANYCRLKYNTMKYNNLSHKSRYIKMYLAGLITSLHQPTLNHVKPSISNDSMKYRTRSAAASHLNYNSDLND